MPLCCFVSHHNPFSLHADGGVAASVADVRTVEDHLKPSDLQAFHAWIQSASLVMLDANLCPETLEVRVSALEHNLAFDYCCHVLCRSVS